MMKKWWVLLIGVLIIIGVCAVIPGVRNIFLAPFHMVDAVNTGMEIKQIEALITGHKKQLNRWPTEDEFYELVDEAYKTAKSQGKKAEGLFDMWGEPYNYFRQGSGFVLKSMGPDKKPGTEDDVIFMRRK